MILTGLKKALFITRIGILSARWFFQKGGNRALRNILFHKYADHEIQALFRGFLYEGRYYWNLYLPGFPSKAFSNTLNKEMDRLVRGHGTKEQYYLLFLAITNKCSLNCAHCYEWDFLNKKESLSKDAIFDIVKKYQQKNLGQIFFTGGEPLNRFDTLIKILPSVKDAETWIISSGWHLTEDKATALKANGLTGALISLDHYVEEKHDEFRGLPKSYYWALLALKNAQSAGLITALSLCPTNEFIESNSFAPYMKMAQSLGVKFVQIIEPKPEGRNFDGDLVLTSSNKRKLENLFNEFNSGKIYRSFPIIIYTDYLKRLYGCEGVYERHRYIDTKGIEHPCPFCKMPDDTSTINFSEKLKSNGCRCTFQMEKARMEI